jgi:hypothetical protein
MFEHAKDQGVPRSFYQESTKALLLEAEPRHLLDGFVVARLHERRNALRARERRLEDRL